ncbi:MAG: hypothetical protein DYG91_14580 [Chloroflexi bacterium CFX7]|nr:hypothetical protein [Chloroflexi bacterium CFX7]
MSVTVTLQIFSGVPNPTWELSDAQAREFASRLASLNSRTLSKPPGIAGGLGYRGFVVESSREPTLDPFIYVHANVIDLARLSLNLLDNDVQLEEWLLGSAGGAIDDELRALVQGDLTGLRQGGLVQPLGVVPSAGPSLLAVPPYNPGKWNNDPNIRTRNNCYNYANDVITNTFAQPGRGSGAMYGSLACGDVGAAAGRDGLRSVGSASGTPAQGHFAALVIWPGRDFHWYRLDAGGAWSHKPGQTPVRDTDNSGNRIGDPRTCNRGPYTDFCGYYQTIPGSVRIL